MGYGSRLPLLANELIWPMLLHALGSTAGLLRVAEITAHKLVNSSNCSTRTPCSQAVGKSETPWIHPRVARPIRRVRGAALVAGGLIVLLLRVSLVRESRFLLRYSGTAVICDGVKELTDA